MGRIRTVKPELFKHEELYDLELEMGLPIRVAFIGLFTCCDRDGRFKWRPRTLKLDILPHDEIDFSRVLDALWTRGFVEKYAMNNEDFGFIPTFLKHQVINNRESHSDIPAPDENSLISSTSTRQPRVDCATTTPLMQDQGEGKGKEGKGREGERKGIEGKETYAEPRVATPDHDPIPDIFGYWQKTMSSPNSKLDKKRIDKIRAALKMGYTPRQLCEAIKGCAQIPHNMGTGPDSNGTKYNGIELIFRSADHIDRFMAAAGGGVRAGGKETVEQHNARVMAEFLGEQAVNDLNDLNTIDMEDVDEQR